MSVASPRQSWRWSDASPASAEIADVALLPGAGLHGILNHTDTTHRAALALPEQGFWAPIAS